MIKAVAWGIYFMSSSYGATVPLDITQQYPFYTQEQCEQGRALVVAALEGWDYRSKCIPIRFEVQ